MKLYSSVYSLFRIFFVSRYLNTWLLNFTDRTSRTDWTFTLNLIIQLYGLKRFIPSSLSAGRAAAAVKISKKRSHTFPRSEQSSCHNITHTVHVFPSWRENTGTKFLGTLLFPTIFPFYDAVNVCALSLREQPLETPCFAG